MEHHHGHHHHHGSGKNLKWAFWLNFSFTIIELFGGLYTNSVAIISDAIHDFGDTLAIGSAWYFEKLSGKKRDSKFSYGYKRFSTLSALITSIILVIGSVVIVWEAIPRLFNPQPVVSEGMMVLAVLGIFFNGLAVFKMNKNNGSLNAKAVRLHLLEDLLGWFAVLIGAIVIYFTNLTQIDSLLSIAIACYIFFNAFKNLKAVFGIFLQGVPATITEKQIEAELKTYSQIKEVHDIHLWSLDGTHHVLTLHVVVDESQSFEDLRNLKKTIKNGLKKHHIDHITIEFEAPKEPCEQQNC